MVFILEIVYCRIIYKDLALWYPVVQPFLRMRAAIGSTHNEHENFLLYLKNKETQGK